MLLIQLLKFWSYLITLIMLIDTYIVVKLSYIIIVKNKLTLL